MRWMAVAYAFYTPPKPISASCGEWLTAARDLALEAKSLKAVTSLFTHMAEDIPFHSGKQGQQVLMF